MSKTRNKRIIEGFKECFRVLHSILFLTALGPDGHKFSSKIIREFQNKRKLKRNRSQCARKS